MSTLRSGILYLKCVITTTIAKVPNTKAAALRGLQKASGIAEGEGTGPGRCKLQNKNGEGKKRRKREGMDGKIVALAGDGWNMQMQLTGILTRRTQCKQRTSRSARRSSHCCCVCANGSTRPAAALLLPYRESRASCSWHAKV